MNAFINTIIFDVLIMIAVIYALVLLFSFIGFLVTLGTEKAPAGEKRRKFPIFRDQLRHYGALIAKEAFPILIICAVIIVLNLSFRFSGEIKTWFAARVSYDTVPVIAAAVDGIALIWPLVKPFLLPLLAVIGLLLILYAIKDSSDARVAAMINNGGRKLRSHESLFLFFNSLEKGFLKICGKLPLAAIILAVLVCVNSLLMTGGTLKKILQAGERIKELQTIVKNLSRSETVAKVSLESMKTLPGRKKPVRLYSVEVLSAAGDTVSKQQIELEGSEFVIDCININFDYSQISSGEQKNLAYPYRVYSELIPAAEGIQLDCMFNEEGLPFNFCLDDKEIYGINPEAFYARLGELMKVLKNEDLSREMGIRSTIGNAPRLRMNIGDVYYIDVEQTGGISAYKKQF
ncbi:MAG: hypothetical protein K5930_00535 [Treponemataceae bacterium]|nr:hypothetical protein [Treponemataceae bacterium]